MCEDIYAGIFVHVLYSLSIFQDYYQFNSIFVEKLTLPSSDLHAKNLSQINKHLYSNDNSWGVGSSVQKYYPTANATENIWQMFQKGTEMFKWNIKFAYCLDRYFLSRIYFDFISGIWTAIDDGFMSPPCICCGIWHPLKNTLLALFDQRKQEA